MVRQGYFIALFRIDATTRTCDRLFRWSGKSASSAELWVRQILGNRGVGLIRSVKLISRVIAPLRVNSVVYLLVSLCDVVKVVLSFVELGVQVVLSSLVNDFLVDLRKLSSVADYYD